MRKFLLLVVVLAVIGLVSCANNAGGGSGSDSGSSGNGGTSGQENLPNSQNWYVGTWQGQNLEYDDKIFSQKMEINTDGSWKFYITETNTGKIYDFYTKPLTESTTGYSIKGIYEVKTDSFSWTYQDGTTGNFSGGIYLKTDERVNSEGIPTQKFKESRFFYDEATEKAFFLTLVKDQKDMYTKL